MLREIKGALELDQTVFDRLFLASYFAGFPTGEVGKYIDTFLSLPKSRVQRMAA
jgi:hypothetical protein